MTSNSVSNPRIFPGYVLITTYMVRHTYFFSIFVKKLAQFYESGIWGKLQQHIEVMTSFSVLIKFKETISKTTGISIKESAGQCIPSRSQMYYFSRYSESGEPSAVETDLSFDMVKCVFYVFNYIMLYALLMFFMESFAVMVHLFKYSLNIAFIALDKYLCIIVKKTCSLWTYILNIFRIFY